MKDILIEQYVNRITLSDINSFASKNGIYLKNDVLELIYKYIKNDYKTIIYGNVDSIFNELKSKINEEDLNKIKSLYFEYKQKYRNYLT